MSQFPPKNTFSIPSLPSNSITFLTSKGVFGECFQTTIYSF